MREVPEEDCEIVPNKVCKPENNLVPYLDPVTQCKDVPKETCSFGVLSKLGEKPLVTKWCYDEQHDLISGNLKRKGKLTFDHRDKDGSFNLDNGDSVEKTLRFSQFDDDIAITDGRLLQDVESVKNAPSHGPVDKSIIEEKKTNPLSFDSSNHAFENLATNDFNSFQEMIN